MIFGSYIAIWDHEFGLRYRDGKFVRVLESGRHRIDPRRDTIVRLPRGSQFELIGGQEFTSKDGGGIRISLAIEFVISDPKLFVAERGIGSPSTFYTPKMSVYLDSYSEDRTLVYRAKEALRDWVTGRSFSEALESQTTIVTDLMPGITGAGTETGITVQNLLLLEFIAAGNLRQVATDVLRAELEGRAALQRARNESATMRSLLNTARLVRENPGLLELRAITGNQKARVSLNFHSGGHEGSLETPQEEKE